MHFTEGQLREYERMMQEKPGFDRRQIRTVKEQDCEHCMYLDKQCKTCSKEKCDLFEN